MTRRYRVDAFMPGGHYVESATIEADASDTALHEMAQRCPNAERFEATDVTGHDDLERKLRKLSKELWATHPNNDVQPTNHEGVVEPTPEWEIRRYLVTVRDFMRLRAEAGESPSQTLGARNTAWAHLLMDRLIETIDDPARCRRETQRLEEQIAAMRDASSRR